MFAIVLARKPMKGTVVSAVLKHGTGALDIESSRIKINSDAEPDSGAMYYKARGLPMPANRTNYFRGEDSVVTSSPLPNGRWPANLILNHLPGCRRVGSVSVKSDGHYPASRPSGSQERGPSGHVGQRDLVEAKTSGESVSVWSCVDGCPAREINRQSGHTRSSGGVAIKRRSASDTQGYTNRKLGAESRPEGTVMSLYDDAGGASRFFKQTGGQDGP